MSLLFVRQKAQAALIVILNPALFEPLPNQIGAHKFLNDLPFFAIDVLHLLRHLARVPIIGQLFFLRLPIFEILSMAGRRRDLWSQHLIKVRNDDVANRLLRAANRSQARDVSAVIFRLELRPTEIVRNNLALDGSDHHRLIGSGRFLRCWRYLRDGPMCKPIIARPREQSEIYDQQENVEFARQHFRSVENRNYYKRH